jgi:hypothetical protein
MGKRENTVSRASAIVFLWIFQQKIAKIKV